MPLNRPDYTFSGAPTKATDNAPQRGAAPRARAPPISPAGGDAPKGQRGTLSPTRPRCGEGCFPSPPAGEMPKAERNPLPNPPPLWRRALPISPAGGDAPKGQRGHARSALPSFPLRPFRRSCKGRNLPAPVSPAGGDAQGREEPSPQPSPVAEEGASCLPRRGRCPRQRGTLSPTFPRCGGGCFPSPPPGEMPRRGREGPRAARSRRSCKGRNLPAPVSPRGGDAEGREGHEQPQQKGPPPCWRRPFRSFGAAPN